MKDYIFALRLSFLAMVENLIEKTYDLCYLRFHLSKLLVLGSLKIT